MAISPANPAGSWVFNVLAGALGVLYFLAKTYGFFFVMVWVRGAFARLRVDQLMDFGWKLLVPLTLVNIFSAAIWVALTTWGAADGLAFVEGWSPLLRWAAAFVATLALNLGAYLYLVRVFAEAQAGRARMDDEVLEQLTNVV
jgi:NADH-quinone oxidoreductase subunit H